ncbi:sulfatase [Cyclobacterium xiamenense]|uniref:sulfatase family protein n=1 Tax=Cyclobacterium xiamenense TaxID=1297121 RepID=UPI0035CF8223
MDKFIVISIVLVQLFMGETRAGEENRPPNIVLIVCDDLGYGDLSGYGSVWNQTPEIDQLMTEGLRFTQFYAGAPVCTPSRAGLMTGSYARRVNLDLDTDNRWVLFPKSSKGINPEEVILPEILKDAGYATAIVGKWHLGDQPEFLPMNHGFDFWYGMPYSNDMGVRVNDAPLLPLMRNKDLVERITGGAANREHQATLTQKYTEAAVMWMRENKEYPFFLYLAHTMPHVPVAAKEAFYQQTNHPNEHYGASVAEISWSTGEIMQYLKETHLAENTLVIFTSDNGGAQRFGASNGILRGNKGLVYEGGIRVPFIAWWPGKIRPGTTCHAQASFLDLLPTFAALTHGEAKGEIKRDGTDISSYFFNPEKERAPRPFFYWHAGYLMAVRFGDWKLNLLAEFSARERENILKSTYNMTEFPANIELYNLREDPAERLDLSDENPEIVARLIRMAQAERKGLGQYEELGPEVRKTLFIENPKYLFD